MVKLGMLLIWLEDWGEKARNWILIELQSAGKKSKRTPTRLRAKIQKASAAKQRKMRKLAKKVRLELSPRADVWEGGLLIC